MSKIGIFDSGFGGLTILKEIVCTLPEYDYVYLGDTERAPYGSHAHETIHTFTSEALLFLFAQECDLVILACNTASAEALHVIQNHLLPHHFPTKKVLGVIVPTVESIIEISQSKRIGILATESTVASKAFVREIRKRDPSIVVTQSAAPLLVPLIERGDCTTETARGIVKRYVQPLIDADVDTIVLGCTHYSILFDIVRDIVPDHITILAEGPVVAASFDHYLRCHADIETDLSRLGKRTFYTTGIPHYFAEHGGLFYGEPLVAEHVTITR